MKAVIMKQSMKADKHPLDKGYLYIFTEQKATAMLEYFSKNLVKAWKYLDMVQLEDEMPLFAEDKLPRKVYIIRSGGIGDLLALSGLVKYLNDKYSIIPTIVTQSKYFEIFNWFDCRVQFMDMWQGIKYDVKYKFNKPLQMNFEGEIEQTNENWFHVFFKLLDKKHKQYFRPHLINHYGEVRLFFKPSIMLCLKSTAWIRSIRFNEVYTSLLNVVGESDFDILVHENNISEDEKRYIFSRNDRRIKILESGDINTFFLQLSAADYVISVDSGAIHFREGIEKPALGIYTTFSAECRAKYYRHVTTIDFKSPCPHQPCYQHARRHFDKCRLMAESGIELQNFAPCLHSSYNPTITEQLSDALRQELPKYFKTMFKQLKRA